LVEGLTDEAMAHRLAGAVGHDMVHAWLPHREQGMLLRAVVRELESWLLSDRNGIADYLKIPMSMVPENPESMSDPKATLIHLARRSRSSKIRDGLVPAQGSSATVGREYTSGIIHFIRKSWNMNRARMKASSLDHCIRRLEDL